MCCTRLARNAGRKKSPSGHHRTTLSGYIFGTKERIDNRKKIVKQRYVLHVFTQYGELRPISELRHVSTIGKKLLSNDRYSTCPYNMVNFSLLTAEICWRAWSTPANFNGFRVLAALLHGTLVVGVSRSLQR